MQQVTFKKYFDSKTKIGFKYTILFAYFSFDQKLVISLDVTSKLPVSFENFKNAIITILVAFV